MANSQIKFIYSLFIVIILLSMANAQSDLDLLASYLSGSFSRRRRKCALPRSNCLVCV
jgi:hypothetical protein